MRKFEINKSYKVSSLMDGEVKSYTCIKRTDKTATFKIDGGTEIIRKKINIGHGNYVGKDLYESVYFKYGKSLFS